MNDNDIEGKLCPDDEQETPTTASTTKTSLKYKYELIVPRCARARVLETGDFVCLHLPPLSGDPSHDLLCHFGNH